MLYIPRVADRIKYGALIQWLKTSEVTDKIWWKIGLSFFFVTVESDLRWRMRVIWRSWMLLILTCFILLKGPFVTMNLKKWNSFYFADNENSSYKLSAVNNHFSPVTKWRRHRFWYLIEFEQFMRIFKNGGMEWHSDFTVLQYRMRLSR